MWSKSLTLLLLLGGTQVVNAVKFEIYSGENCSEGSSPIGVQTPPRSRTIEVPSNDYTCTDFTITAKSIRTSIDSGHGCRLWVYPDNETCHTADVSLTPNLSYYTAHSNGPNAADLSSAPCHAVPFEKLGHFHSTQPWKTYRVGCGYENTP